ncbi:uncharacterized protein K441DRAFT_265727 [Cenococcum geophilum 1.58]|uniref:uncharacterized protein n=1 Tax=Cenococcum geophilum 1.58 TaxID=794803 RepID=UPI00358EC62F|nr:hypothetical protein K441DRAFT_265727 [Cenococcum geophilum 1.58]
MGCDRLLLTNILLLLILLILLNILIYFVSWFFVLDQKVAKIYTTARLSRYILPGLLLSFLLELLYSDISSAFSNLSACFAALVGLAMLFFR